MLGKILLSSTPMNEPVNIIGIEAKANLYWITGLLLYCLYSKLNVLPLAAPRTQEKTTKLASFGK